MISVMFFMIFFWGMMDREPARAFDGRRVSIRDVFLCSAAFQQALCLDHEGWTTLEDKDDRSGDGLGSIENKGSIYPLYGRSQCIYRGR